MNPEKAKLLLKTFDGSLTWAKLAPKCTRTRAELAITYFDYDNGGAVKKGRLVFDGVVSAEFSVNYFDNYIGAELFGFYEILEEEEKKKLVERVFAARREAFLLPGDYDYDPGEAADMLNRRGPVEEIYDNLGQYHLYCQQTQGGAYTLLARGYALTEK